MSFHSFCVAPRTCVTSTKNTTKSQNQNSSSLPLLALLCFFSFPTLKDKMAEEQHSKWEGKTSVDVPNTDMDRAWCLLEDFCNLHKLMNIDTCYQVEGSPGQPGLVRYCATTVHGQGEADTTLLWAKEKLLSLDSIQRCLTYETLDNNVGFKSYVATIKVLPMGSDVDAQGCKIEWSFVSDPVEGWTFEGLISYIESSLNFMANKMQQQPCSAN